MRDANLTRAARAAMIQPDPFDPPNEVIDTVDRLLDAAWESLYTPDEAFRHCLMCDHVDGHDDACPVPALRAWREAV